MHKRLIITVLVLVASCQLANSQTEVNKTAAEVGLYQLNCGDVTMEINGTLEQGS